MVPLISKFRRSATGRLSSSNDSSSPSSSNSHKKMKRSNNKKTVTFSESVCVRDTIHIKDYCPTEVCASWYDKSDINRMKEDIKSTLERLREGFFINNNVENDVTYEDDDEDVLCLNGLEPFTMEGSSRRKRNRSEAYKTVFEEQEGQADYGIVDQEAIALLYACCTRRCQTIAHSIGLQVAQDVRKMQHSFGEKKINSCTTLLGIQKSMDSNSRIVVVGQHQQRILSKRIAQAA